MPPGAQKIAYNTGSLAYHDVEGYCLDSRLNRVLSPQQQIQRGIQLPGLPKSLQGLHIAYKEGSKARQSASRLEEAGYRWVHLCLTVQAWQKVVAEEQSAAELAVWDGDSNIKVRVSLASPQIHGVVASMYLVLA